MTVTTETTVKRRASEFALLLCGPLDAKCLTVAYDVPGPGDPAPGHKNAVAFGLKALAAENLNPADYRYRVQERVGLDGGVYYRTVCAMDFREAVDVAAGRLVPGVSFAQCVGRACRGETPPAADAPDVIPMPDDGVVPNIVVFRVQKGE